MVKRYKYVSLHYRYWDMAIQLMFIIVILDIFFI